MTVDPVHLLLVQDNPFLAEMIARGLRERGYRVLPVPNEAQALAVLRDQRFDLLMLDLDLRRCEGLSLLRAVARRAPFVPLVALLGPVNYQDALMQLGPGRAVWRLDRPYALDALATVVERLTSARGGQRVATRRFASAALTDLIEA
jgi:DNA-binding response OmpR family regulator